MSAQLNLSAISLTNFRGFKTTDDIPLAPLTFLVGPNSSGKSSLFLAIALIAQSDIELDNPLLSEIAWSGRLIDAGSFSDVVYAHKTNLTMKVALQLSDHPSAFHPFRRVTRKSKRPTPMRLTIAMRKAGKEKIGVISSIEILDVLSGQKLELSLTPKRPRSPAKLLVKIGSRSTKISGAPSAARRAYSRELVKALNFRVNAIVRRNGALKPAWRRITNIVTGWNLLAFLNGAQRVSSGRTSPKRWYPLRGSNEDPDDLAYAYRSRFDSVDPAIIDASHEAESRKRARRARIERFLRTLEIASQVDAYKLSPYHSAIRVKDEKTGIKSNLIDVGYGASQIIPVLAACESEARSPLFVEQPEIHLHPRAQGDVGDLLIDTSKLRQVFVETHSVHLINRARLRIVKGSLSPKEVIVLYVNRDKRGSHVLPIRIGPDGEFDTEWPEGFFEERYQETLDILEVKSKSKE